MKYRKLRVAWSVAWGVVAVLMAVLWVRSFWWQDSVAYQINDGQYVACSSMVGRMALGTAYSKRFGSWEINHVEVDDGIVKQWDSYTIALGFGELVSDPRYFAIIPFYAIVASIVALATTPWLKCWHRFSLFTLLTAMMLVAVVLGLTVWAIK